MDMVFDNLYIKVRQKEGGQTRLETWLVFLISFVRLTFGRIEPTKELSPFSKWGAIKKELSFSRLCIVPSLSSSLLHQIGHGETSRLPSEQPAPSQYTDTNQLLADSVLPSCRAKIDFRCWRFQYFRYRIKSGRARPPVSKIVLVKI
jgi:hypothetical protein